MKLLIFTLVYTSLYRFIINYMPTFESVMLLILEFSL